MAIKSDPVGSDRNRRYRSQCELYVTSEHPRGRERVFLSSGGRGVGGNCENPCCPGWRRALARNGKRSSRQDRHTVHRAVASAHPRTELDQPVAIRRHPSINLRLVQRMLPHLCSCMPLYCQPLTSGARTADNRIADFVLTSCEDRVKIPRRARCARISPCGRCCP